MKITKTAVVTALFDICEENWENFKMTKGGYSYWMKSLLRIDCNLIIYTEEKLKQRILQDRKEVDPLLEKTIIFTQSFQDTEGYRIFAKPLRKIMSTDEFKSKLKGNDSMDMTHYEFDVINYSKLFFIKDSIEKKLFDADMYIWADAGIHRKEMLKVGYKWPSLNKINEIDNTKITFFSIEDSLKIFDREKHILSQRKFMQGGVFFVPKQCINEICEDFKQMVFECIENGYVGTDQNIIEFIYLKNPERFNIIKCWWREYISTFSNEGG